MKKIFTILISILLVALLIFCVHSCIKKDETPENPQVVKPNSPENQPVFDNPNTEENESEEANDPVKTSDQVFTETGIYNGKIDNSFIEVTIGSDIPLSQAYKLSPEIAEKLSSYNLERDSIITFEYQEIDGQYVITKIIQ